MHRYTKTNMQTDRQTDVRTQTCINTHTHTLKYINTKMKRHTSNTHTSNKHTQSQPMTTNIYIKHTYMQPYKHTVTAHEHTHSGENNV